MSVKKAPRLPQVGEYVRHHGTLVAIEEVTPPPLPPPTGEYIFEEIVARWEVRLHGNWMRDGNYITDFYGKGTSVEEAVREAKSWAATQGITPQSDLEVVVIKTVSHFRALPKQQENFYDRTFLDFEPLSYGSRRGVIPEVETIEWSSKTP